MAHRCVALLLDEVTTCRALTTFDKCEEILRSLMIPAMAAVLIASTTGCAVQKTLTPIGGSRSDGVVRLAFTYGLFEQPKVDQQQAYRAASQRCAAWGYSDAEAFGGHSTQCINGTYQGCNEWQVTVEYQCTGRPEATPAQSPPPATNPTTATFENHPGG